MAKLTSPNISVTFTELGISAITRGDKGTVAIIVRDAAQMAPFALSMASQIPDILGAENQKYIRRAFTGYIDPPRKVLVYTAPARDADGGGTDETLSEALDWMATQNFDYLVGPPDCTGDEAEAIASWVRSQRAAACVKYKAVLPNYGADSYAIVNFVGDGMTDGVNKWTTAEYCSRIAGLLAGTPMKIAATFAPLPELSDCARLTREEGDEVVGDGKLALRWDGRQVKLNRAVNSFVTTIDGMGDSFKKIKLVEAMDLIRTDITATAEDSYIGKYPNSYDNKLLLITAIRGYFQGLVRDSLVQPGFTVDIDVEAQEQYLTSRGVDTSEMSEREIREADTGTWVFILIRCKILDAIEDIDINIEI